MDLQPGPGQYNNITLHSRLKNEPLYSFSKQSRYKEDTSFTNNPSPLHYDTLNYNRGRNSPKFGFGTSSRDSSNEKNNKIQAGPGSYNLPSIIG